MPEVKTLYFCLTFSLVRIIGHSEIIQTEQSNGKFSSLLCFEFDNLAALNNLPVKIS